MIGLREGDPTPIFAVGPCGFQYKVKSGAWTLGEACGKAVSGVDGDGSGTLSGAYGDLVGGSVVTTAMDFFGWHSAVHVGEGPPVSQASPSRVLVTPSPQTGR